jgi:hypothetical protein
MMYEKIQTSHKQIIYLALEYIFLLLLSIGTDVDIWNHLRKKSAITDRWYV